MKFREYKRFQGEEVGSLILWAKNELNAVLREVLIGLRNLTFLENFNSFQWEGTLAVTEERQIPHPFGKTPTGYLIIRQVGDAVVDAGTTTWTNEVVYLRNNSGANTVTLTVIFFV